MEENILTKHPEGESGVNIKRDKHNAVRDFLGRTPGRR